MKEKLEIQVEEEVYDTESGKYNITKIEPVDDFEDNGMLENNFITLTKMTLDRFLKEDNPIELISVYSFYYYTAKWQKTNVIKATTNYVAKGLKVSDRKIMQIKKQLIQMGLIEDIQRRDKNNKITGHYVRVNYILKNKTIHSHTVEFPQCGNSHSVAKKQTNALRTNNINALNSNNINALSKSAKADLPESDSLIEIPKKNISILDDEEILISGDNVILEINGKEETYNLKDNNSLELELNKNIKLLSSGKENTIPILARIYLLTYLIKYKTNFRKKLYPRDYKNLKTILLDYGSDKAFKLLLYSINNWDRIKNNLNIKNQIPTIDNIIKYRQQLDIFRNQETQKKNKKQGEW